MLLHGAGFCFLLLLLLLLEPSSASLRFRFCRSCRFQDEKRKPKIDILRLASTQLLALSSDLSRLFCLNGHVTENFSSRDSHSANRRGSSELKSVLLFLRMLHVSFFSNFCFVRAFSNHSQRLGLICAADSSFRFSAHPPIPAAAAEAAQAAPQS